MFSVTKKIDDLGRIAIPKEMRKNLSLFGGDQVDIIYQDDNTITVMKHEYDYSKRLENLRQEIYDWMKTAGEEIDFQLLEDLENAVSALQVKEFDLQE